MSQVDELFDLDAAYLEILECIEEIGITVFPRSLRFPAKDVITANWGHGVDWRSFLVLAPNIGATVVYLDRDELTDDDLPENQAEPQPPDPAMTSRLGQAIQVSLEYVVNGVVHFHYLMAPWWEDAQDEARVPVGPGAKQQLEALVTQALEGDWAQKIVEDPRFYSARNLSDRWQASTEVLAELGVQMNPMVHVGPQVDLTRWLTNVATSRVEDVRAQVEDRALSDVPDLAAMLMATNPEWSKWRVSLREKVAKRMVVERYGIAMPLIVAEIARWKPT